MMTCPYCSASASTETACEHCGSEIPADYRSAVASATPIRIAFVGYTNHGKTMLINAQMAALERLGARFPGFWVRPIDLETHERFQSVGTLTIDGLAAESTPSAPPRPWVVLADRLPIGLDAQGSKRILIVHDLGGELFGSPRDDQREAMRFMAGVDVFVVVVSPADFSGSAKVGSLLDIFQHLHRHVGSAQGTLSGKRIIVALSKVDEMAAVSRTSGNRIIAKLPDSINDYMTTDPFRGPELKSTSATAVTDMRNYLRALADVQKPLKEYVEANVPNSRPALNMAEGEGVDVAFAATSSTGAALEGSQLVHQLDRLRVLDPIFLALSAQGSSTADGVVLIYDRSATKPDGPRPTAILKAEGLSGIRSIFELGRKRPVGDRAPAGPPAAGIPQHRLCGPILDDKKPSIHVAIVWCDQDPLDLSDFLRTRWRNRLVVASPSGTYQGVWPHHWSPTTGERLSDVVATMQGQAR